MQLRDAAGIGRKQVREGTAGSKGKEEVQGKSAGLRYLTATVVGHLKQTGLQRFLEGRQGF